MAIKEEFVYSFDGFGGYPSRCHIRILEEPDKPIVILCSQMVHEPGTSITNMAEFIAQDAQKYLSRDNITLASAIQKYIKHSTFEKKLGDLIKSLKESGKITIFALESIKLALQYSENYRKNQSRVDSLLWVEHYAPQIGLAENGSYCIVKFAKDTWSPSWDYVNVKALSEYTGYPEDEFNTPNDVFEKP